MVDFILLSTFADINVRHEIKYFMNNKGLLNQLKTWYEKEKTKTDNRIGLQTWMKERAIELESGSAQEVIKNDVVVQLRQNCEE